MTKDLYFMAYKIIPNWVVYWSLLLTAFMHTFAPTFWKSRTGGSKNWWVIRKIYIYRFVWNIPTEGNFSNLPKHWLLSLGPFCNQKALKVKVSEYSNINNFEIWITQCHRIFCTNRYMHIYNYIWSPSLSLSFSLLCLYIYMLQKKKDDRFGKGKLF